MRVRVVSSMVGLGILGVVFAFLDTPLLNAAIGLISVLAVFELLKAAGLISRPGLTVLSMCQAAIIPFIRVNFHIFLIAVIIFCLILIEYFLVLIRKPKIMSIGRAATVFLFTTLAPVSFSCAVFIRDKYHIAQGGFYLLVALGAAWLSDTGAYFVGVYFGKHKLAPKISPKKTVEGSVGGVVVCTLCLLFIGAAYSGILGLFGISSLLNYPLIACLSPLFSIAGMLGDLSASAFKRGFGVKDFGNIMPGHGGILDRFDSVLFTLPAVYLTVGDLELLRLL